MLQAWALERSLRSRDQFEYHGLAVAVVTGDYLLKGGTRFIATLQIHEQSALVDQCLRDVHTQRRIAGLAIARGELLPSGELHVFVLQPALQKQRARDLSVERRLGALAIARDHFVI